MPKAMPEESGPSWRRGAAKDKTLLQRGAGRVPRGEKGVFLWVLGKLGKSFRRDLKESDLYVRGF